MKKEVLTSRQGYAIPCHNCLNGENRAVIVCHGFGSSKESPMVQALNETLPRHGIGVYSFDFPSHGESPVWQEGLLVPFCLEDLAVVEDHVRAQLPGVRVGYFGSSFGAYITLLYLASGRGQGRRLRSGMGPGWSPAFSPGRWWAPIRWAPGALRTPRMGQPVYRPPYSPPSAPEWPPPAPPDFPAGSYKC